MSRLPPLIVDANLLVLLVVGTASPEYIAKHKRLDAYRVEDFDILVDLISKAPAVIVTPNTLTETSNLLRNIAEPARSHISTVFRLIIEQATERMVDSKKASQNGHFIRLGLSDAALLEATDGPAMLLTADLDLYVAALAEGRQAENFNHHRNL